MSFATLDALSQFLHTCPEFLALAAQLRHVDCGHDSAARSRISRAPLHLQNAALERGSFCLELPFHSLGIFPLAYFVEGRVPDVRVAPHLVLLGRVFLESSVGAYTQLQKRRAQHSLALLPLLDNTPDLLRGAPDTCGLAQQEKRPPAQSSADRDHAPLDSGRHVHQERNDCKDNRRDPDCHHPDPGSQVHRALDSWHEPLERFNPVVQRIERRLGGNRFLLLLT